MDQKELKASVREAKHGSAQAFGRLYAKYAADLYRFALWYLHSEADAEDAVQDACLHAFKNLKSLKKEEAFRSWFFKILANICRDKLSRASKLSVVSIDDPDSFSDLADDTSQSFTAMSDLGGLIAALGEPDSQIVLLSSAAGFTSKEIGSMLKLNSSTVRSKLSRSLAKLKEQLEKEEYSV